MAPSFDEIWDSLPDTPAKSGGAPSFDALWDSLPEPSVEVKASAQAGIGDKAASGFLSGLAGFGDIADLASEYSPTNLIAKAVNKVAGSDLLPTAQAESGPGLRSIFDTATGLPNSTQIGADSLPYKIGSYLPAMVGGEAEVLPIAKNLFSTAAAGTGGYFGHEVGGVPGEIVGSLAPGALTGIAAKGASLLSNAGDAIAGSSIFKDAEQIAADRLAPSADAIRRMPLESENPLYQYQTVAEATQDPTLAQLEQEIGKSSPTMNARLAANTAARQDAQFNLLSDLSPEKQVSAEEGGIKLRDILAPGQEADKKAAEQAFSQLDKTVPVDIAEARGKFKSDISQTYESGGIPPKLAQIRRDLDSLETAQKPFSYVHSLRKRAQQAELDFGNNQDLEAARVAGRLVDEIDNAVGKTPLADQFEAAKSQYSEFKGKYSDGPVGYALRGGKENFQYTDSAVPGMAFNGRAENTRAILNALPGDEGSLEQFRGVVRDRILRETLNNDGNLSPGKFRTFIRKNREGLEAASSQGQQLFEPDHIEAIDRVAQDLGFLDPSSETSARQLAYQASKGQPTTAQSLIMGEAGKKLFSKAVPGGKIVSKIGSFITDEKIAEANDLLAQALTDKSYAKLLASKATDDSVGLARSILRGAKNLSGAIDSPFAGQRLQSALPPLIGATQSLRSSGSPAPRSASLGQQAAPSVLTLLAPASAVSSLQSMTQGRSSAGQMQGRILPQGPQGLSTYNNSLPTPSPIQPPIASPTGSGLLSLSPQPTTAPVATKQATSVDAAFSALKQSGKPLTKAKLEAAIDTDPYAATVYQMESSRGKKVTNDTTTAKGPFQFIDETAKKVGLKDPFDLGQSLEAFNKLTDENREKFGDDPAMLYAAHFLGAPVLTKVLRGDSSSLTKDQREQVASLQKVLLPRFNKIYQAKLAEV
jgi:hypothetical protein